MEGRRIVENDIIQKQKDISNRRMVNLAKCFKKGNRIKAIRWIYLEVVVTPKQRRGLSMRERIISQWIYGE